MKIGLLILFLSLLLFACGSIKNGQINEKMQRQSESHIELSTENTILKTELIVFTDSLTNNYKVEILPFGNFSYHPLEGFEGQAEKVVVTGKSVQMPKFTKENFLSLDEHTLTKHSTKEVIDSKIKIQQKEKHPNKTVWIIIAGILIVGLIWWKR